jgi:hypothetical protein
VVVREDQTLGADDDARAAVALRPAEQPDGLRRGEDRDDAGRSVLIDCVRERLVRQRSEARAFAATSVEAETVRVVTEPEGAISDDGDRGEQPAEGG